MTPENFKTVLGKFLKQKPFTPFTLELMSGWEWLNRDEVARIVDLTTEVPA